MQTATEIAEAVRNGTRTAAEVVAEAARVIDETDAEIHAWVHLDREAAAQAGPAGPPGTTGALPLAGVPVGIKDIIDVAGMVTTAGARPFAHRRAERDAEVIARLRRAGALILGKTSTTEFAYLDPSPTRNPWNTGHTPGGSSSGSAAAVAAGMVPIALGTQTVGSVLRPAAYCGIVGFKPGYGWTSTAGVTPLAWSLDHLGLLTRTTADAALAYGALAAAPGTPPPSVAGAILGVPRAFFAERASEAVAVHLDSVSSLFREAGLQVDDVPFPTPGEWSEAGMPVLAAEAATYHEESFAIHREDYSNALRALIERGLETPATSYVRANRARAALRERAVSLFESVDALLLPVAPTTAPLGLSSTGDSVFCAPASFAGLPAIALPSGLDAAGLPFGIQLVGRPGGEWDLLSLAEHVERVLGFRASPPIAAARAG